MTAPGGPLLGRVQFPTGDDHEKDSQGKRLPRPLQLGSGSFDYSAGMVLTNLWQRWGINGDVLYTWNTEANNFEFGDTLRYDLAFAYRLFPRIYKVYPSPQLNLFLEFNGLYGDKHRANGKRLADSGGNEVLIAPGIQYLGKTFILEASVQLPFLEDLNGSLPSTDYTVLFGFRWLIF